MYAFCDVRKQDNIAKQIRVYKNICVKLMFFGVAILSSGVSSFPFTPVRFPANHPSGTVKSKRRF
ncbi:hypothetical protein HanPSC8_Chr15g0646231 [Helianthus annuus]|nr:hypothetical protein HanPSC8_Chr15g0646231 [Helianthus annuus]